VPELIRLYEENNPPLSQRLTAQALVFIGPGARAAIPVFVRSATNWNPNVRYTAVNALAQLDLEPSLVVPTLINSLTDSFFMVQLDAAKGLEHFGTNATQAVPALLLALSDVHPDVRTAATNALKAIAPQAATRAGIQ
jgi:HEAT repeat protein